MFETIVAIAIAGCFWSICAVGLLVFTIGCMCVWDYFYKPYAQHRDARLQMRINTNRRHYKEAC